MDEKLKSVDFVDDVNYDRRDAKAGPVAIVGGASILLIVAFCVGIYWFYTVYSEQVDQDQYAGVASKELIAIHEREDEQLHKYGYVDKAKGVVRLPVERAMQLVEQEASAGKLAWNTKSYAVKPEQPGGAAALLWAADGTSKAAPMAAAADSATTEKNAASGKK